MTPAAPFLSSAKGRSLILLCLTQFMVIFDFATVTICRDNSGRVAFLELGRALDLQRLRTDLWRVSVARRDAGRPLWTQAHLDAGTLDLSGLLDR